MNDSLYVRARLALAVAAQEAADLSRGVVGDVSTPMGPVERIRKARRVRLASITVVDRAVLAVLSEGASWEEVGEGLGISADEAQRRCASTWAQWQSDAGDDPADYGDFTIGLRGDRDMEGTAAMLDQWWRRHAEPYETADPCPVSRVLVDGKPATGDSESI